MEDKDLEKQLEGYRKCFESKHHYDVLSWTIAGVIIVFVGMLLSIISRIHVENVVLEYVCKGMAACVGLSMLLLWDRIYQRNRFWGEVCNEVARDIEKLMKLEGPAHAFMKGHLDKEIILKNTDISGNKYEGHEVYREKCRAKSIHKSIRLVIFILALALIAAVFVPFEI